MSEILLNNGKRWFLENKDLEGEIDDVMKVNQDIIN